MGEGHQEHHRGPGPRLLQQLMETLELEETAGEQHWEETLRPLPTGLGSQYGQTEGQGLPELKSTRDPASFSKGDVHTERKNQHRAAGQLKTITETSGHSNQTPRVIRCLKTHSVPGGGGAFAFFTHLMTGTKCRPTQFCVKFPLPIF